MKKSELRQMIREEIQRVVNEFHMIAVHGGNTKALKIAKELDPTADWAGGVGAGGVRAIIFDTASKAQMKKYLKDRGVKLP